MNIIKENTDNLSAILKIKIEKSDYEEKVIAELKKYRQKVDLKGFRKGMVPMGIVKKMYETPILVEEINKLVSENLTKYLIEEKIDILGEPLPNKEEQKEINWESQEEFEFAFDLGLSPQFDLEPGENDKLPYFLINVDDKMINEQIDYYAKGSGKFEGAEVASEESMIKADIAELDKDGEILDGGISTKDSSIFVRVMKDDDIKKQFIGANKSEIITIDLKKAFPSDAELAGMLKIEKEKVSEMNNDFQITINDISDYVQADVNQELFDKVFGEGVIKTEDEFRNKVKDQIANGLVFESNYKFNIDAKDHLIENSKLELPVNFLKRWLEEVNEDLTKEKIDNEWLSFEKDLKWQLIRSKLAKLYETKVEEKEILEEAMIATRSQLQQYGMSNLPEEQVETFAKQLLEKDEQRKQIEDKKMEDKIMDELRGKVTLDKKEISADDFKALVNPEPQVKTDELQLDDNK